MDTSDINQDIKNILRTRKTTVLAYGEGEDEKLFLRHLVRSYCRTKTVTVQTGSAGGGTPYSIVQMALRARRGEKRDYEFILLDTDVAWTEEAVKLAEAEKIELLGSDPCVEAFFLDILGISVETSVGTGKCKDVFKNLCRAGRFDEDECSRIFPKSIINEARQRNEKLNKIIKILEGEFF